MTTERDQAAEWDERYSDSSRVWSAVNATPVPFERLAVPATR